jgi:myo-inositol-1-phosphate synthase
MIGALGSIAATVVAGALALGRGLIEGTGMVTEGKPFAGLDLVDVRRLRFGGCDVREGSLVKSVSEVFTTISGVGRNGLTELEPDLAALQDRLCRGTVRNCGEAIAGLVPEAALESRSLVDEVESIRRELRHFAESEGTTRVVVVNLASTEPPLERDPCHDRPEDLEAALVGNRASAVRASTLYAYAAVQEGCPYINFTPSDGALIPAIIRLAAEMGVPVMGNDGKTGETLVKSALAPMFGCRNLRVLSWEGFNILGNLDGRVLNHPDNRAAKIRTKDRVLAGILGYAPHSRVHIDYVPSLEDQKTAWDFIHFEGFMGARMSLQFIWQGYDSLLAAPLVLDLVRLADLAGRRGESGLMPHLASFFKAPLGVSEHRLHEQHQMLLDYVERAKASSA